VRVIIDGRFLLDEADLHRRLAGAFGYGPCYRYELPSLHERLAAGDPRPVQLTWSHAAAIRLALGRATFDRFVAVLRAIEAQDAGRSWNERFVFHLLDE
jgi:RNAse (barnase) inhibitor barstar